ncbi:MAG TPA: gephyrin-like molybdotransferase Glp [Syntrophales bacterium]|nr:gephyrin-like molybdotransferase Glp [Syntrophales bacterium]
MIPVAEALKTILEGIHPLGCENVPIASVLGCVLGEDIVSGRTIPPLANSAMDGYAVIAADTAFASRENPVVLDVLEDVPAGRVATQPIRKGQAIRIMTGAPLPVGANAVIRVEDTEALEDRVKIQAAAAPGLDIREAGEDVQTGELVIPKGCVLRAAEIGMLAALGRSYVSVHQRPVVAVVSTGDELVEIDETPGPGKIVNSNGYSLAAMVLEAGGIPLQVGIARDNREDLLAKFRTAARADIVVSSGGVSVGDYDLVKEIMAEIGNRIQFWRVAMRPGRPLAFGRLEGKPLFGLPGNPVSSMVSFEQFIRPSILKMRGYENLFRKAIRAEITERITKKKGLKYFLRARVEFRDGKYLAATTGEQGSGILKSMVLANGLIVLPEDLTAAKPGDEVAVQLLDESFSFVSIPAYLQA